MKLLAGMALFLLCALAGGGMSRRLQGRVKTLSAYLELIRAIGEMQLRGLISFQEGVLRCPPSPERDQLLTLLRGEEPAMPLLTAEERAGLAAYARTDSRSVSALRQERDGLAALLQRGRDQARLELSGRGRVCRSVGYLCGAAALLLVL